MNISEFERTKPTKTFAAIKSCMDKYESYIRQIDPVMDDTDYASVSAYQEILEDLHHIKSLFLKGE